MKKPEFRTFVRELILEIKQEKSEPKGVKDYTNGESGKYKKNVNVEPDEAVSKLVDKISTITNEIDKAISVLVDDHDDIKVEYPGVFTIRINPKWNDNFDVEAFRNMTDRVYAIGLSFEQVLDFIKRNFSEEKKSYVQTAYNKSMDHLKDASEKKSKEIPAGRPVDQVSVGKKDVVDAVKVKADEPDADMTVVNQKKLKLQADHSAEKNKEMSKIQKQIKAKSDKDLTKSWKK